MASTPVLGFTTMTGYVYDAEGTRVAKGTITTVQSLVSPSNPYGMSCDPSVNGLATAGNETDYVLGPGGEQVTEMAQDANGTMNWQRTYVYGAGGLIATYDPDPDNVSQPLPSFRLTDWLGTLRATTDAYGVAQGTCTGLPFGDGVSCSGDIPDNHHFTGKERDAESGNDYFGARYYASTMGRFLSPDWSAQEEPVPYAKMGDPQSLNLYSYVLNNPLTHFDPDGHGCSGANAAACADIGGQRWAEEGYQESVDNDYEKAQHKDNELQAQQQNDGTPSVIVHGGNHWWNRLGASLAIGFARFGRLGGPAHRAAIGRISQLLEESGYSVTQEKYIPTENGAKGYRFADVYGKNDSTGEVRLYQVGRTNANGTPVSREVQAMDDIEGATGIRPQFIDYNNPVLTGEMPVMPTGDMPAPGAGGIPEGEIPIEP